MLKINDILKVQELKFYYKLENQMLPKKFTSLFVRNVDVHNYNTRLAQNIRIPLSKHNFVRNSIRFQIPNIINNIPACIKEKIYTHSVQSFGKYCKAYMINRYEENL